jgi:DNA-binding NarL/FixJ family response regulator
MNETAIVVDDDESVNESLSELLEAFGIKVVGKGFNGEDAVKLFSAKKPNYSLIDLSMPTHDGFFAIENIRKISKSAKIFVITGDVSTETKERIESLDLVGLIYKPFEIDSLLKILRSEEKHITKNPDKTGKNF